MLHTQSCHLHHSVCYDKVAAHHLRVQVKWKYKFELLLYFMFCGANESFATPSQKASVRMCPVLSSISNHSGIFSCQFSQSVAFSASGTQWVYKTGYSACGEVVCEWVSEWVSAMETVNLKSPEFKRGCKATSPKGSKTCFYYLTRSMSFPQIGNYTLLHVIILLGTWLHFYLKAHSFFILTQMTLFFLTYTSALSFCTKTISTFNHL